ncbi:nitrogen fixation protein FixH [Limnohabitans planktonicus]|uniref:Nitrogen fixation protein FixH n=1 Tax=Limnohabitans planktonicus II-D5 TaxID=1293045 RepID=A0A2T7UGL7_9BURK|nr:nitrogen fixation protein FixH [Limnohabitans planktonicus]PVE43833.1 nitrogen fixation protein FixH [Limnohabitans planktonicus II-D5]|eukprot:gene22241-28356_t
MPSHSSLSLQDRPWWTHGHVWLIISGPLLVVIASFVTFYLAANGQDPVLSTQEVSTQSQGDGITLAPAVQARNHAATGELPEHKSNK